SGGPAYSASTLRARLGEFAACAARRAAKQKLGGRMKLVLHPPVEAERLSRIVAAAGTMSVVNAAYDGEALRQIPDADAFFGKITPPLLAAAKKLRWVQSPTVSLEHYMFPELIAHSCVLTNMRGLFSDVIADQVM